MLVSFGGVETTCFRPDQIEEAERLLPFTPMRKDMSAPLRWLQCRHLLESRPSARLAATCLMLVALLSGCGPGATMGAMHARPVSLNADSSTRFAALLAHSRDLGPVAPSVRVSFLALLRDPRSRHRMARLAAIYDPHSKFFGHYMSPRQWARWAGPPSAAVARVRALLRAAGIIVDWQPGNDWMLLSGPARAVERVFRVQIHDYQALSGRRFYAAARDPVIPPALAPIIAGTGHISSYTDRHGQAVSVTGLTPTDLLTAYDIAPLRRQNLDGSGETIAFLEIDGFSHSDFDAFTQHFGLPAMHPVIAAGPKLSTIDGEAELDMEVAHEIAPGAKLMVYNCSSSCSNNEMLHLESQAVQQTPRGIISISLGGCESAEGSSFASAESSVFGSADALGESVVVASGDNGGFTCLDQDWGAPPGSNAIGVSAPASSPTVTAVGGTRLSVNSNATWYREEVWENAPATAGSGGGVSVYFRRPSWQAGPGVANRYDPSGRREVPDVAAVADPVGSVQIVVDGNLTEVGGTSQAAPIWAGITALIDQYLRRHKERAAGFLNPALYALAAGKPAYSPFHDVTVGTNLLYPATPGYDLATGLGSPNAWNLARDLAAYEAGR